MSVSRPPSHRSEMFEVPSLWRQMGVLPGDSPFETEGMFLHVRRCLRIWPIAIMATLPAMALNFSLLFRPDREFSLSMLLLSMLVFIPWYLARSIWFRREKPFAQVRYLSVVMMFIGMVLPVANIAVGQAVLIHPAASTATWLLVFYAAILVRLPAALIGFCLGQILAFPFVGFGFTASLFAITQLCVVVLLAVRQARLDYVTITDRIKTEAEAKRANRLLVEFEATGNGWFWETNRFGHIEYISPKLSRLLGMGDKGLIGKPLTILSGIASSNDHAIGSGERSLSFYLTSRTAFEDVAVMAEVNGLERWWSVSGRPVMNQFGQFRGFVGSGSDLTEQRRSEAEVTKLARFDPLTGLANRAETSKLLKDALKDRLGRTRPCGLMLLDLDRFKAVNDTMGHPAGDELLKQVSQRLVRCVGTMGQVGRLGGDEFKVVLPNLNDVGQLAALSHAIIAAISSPFFINGNQVSIGTSIGIAVSPENGEEPDELVRNADLALYAAKEAGRETYRFYEIGMHSAAEDRRLIEEEMRTAITQGQFHLVFQAIVSVKSESVVGFESLVRWDHPTRGLISPGVFIPIAEESRLIEPLGEWILREACNEAAKWPVKARVAVNVSPIQFANPALPAIVSQALSQSGLDPNQLELEITESVFVNDGDVTDRQFAALKALGVRLALDDFGTGYSSLSYLQRAPFDKIKIDQSFVRGATDPKNRNAAIIKAIVMLADSLNMETTVEGVETHDEIELVRNLGCSHIQGFVYGKPMPATDVLSRMNGTGSQASRQGHKISRRARYTVLRRADLLVQGRRGNVRLRNLSVGGASFEPSYNVLPNSRVTLEISDGPSIEGTVRWVTQNRAGVEFDRAISMEDLNAPMAWAS